MNNTARPPQSAPGRLWALAPHLAHHRASETRREIQETTVHDDNQPTPADPAHLTAVRCVHGVTNCCSDYDSRPTSVQLADTRDRLDIAQADAERQLRNSRHLAGLLEHIAKTLGADPLDLNELPALVDGLRTTRDQIAIQVSDLRHHLDRIKQSDIDRLKAHLGIRAGQAVGIALVPHTAPHDIGTADGALVREPAYEAARGVITQLPGDARDNARLWAAIEAALDAMGVPAGIDLTATIADRTSQTQELPPRVDDLGTPLHAADLGDEPGVADHA